MHNYIKTFLLVVVFLCGVQGASSFKNLDECTEEEREGILKSQVYISHKHFPTLYQAVYDLQQLFEISGVKYVTLFGASLGILRNEELIPWDDNVDFGVAEDQEEKIKALIPLADKLGYDFYEDDLDGYKFSRRDTLFNEANGQNYNLLLNICLYRLEGERYILERSKGREIFPNSWLKKEELEAIEMRCCGPLKLPCSSYAKDHVMRMYGEHCVSVGHFYYSSIRGGLVPTRYIWSISNVAKYPSYKDIKLENRSGEITKSAFVSEIESEVTRLTKNLGVDDCIDLDQVSQSIRQHILTTTKTDQKVVNGLYQAVKDVTEVLTHFGIDHWAVGGTLRGTVRLKYGSPSRGGMFPWSNDADFAVNQKDEDKLKSLAVAELFDKIGYGLCSDEDTPEPYVGYKVYAKKMVSLGNKEVPVFVDLFLSQREGDRYVLTRPLGRTLFNNAWYFADEVEKKETYPFGELNIPGPSNVAISLSRNYGPEWYDFVLYRHSHFGEVKFKYKWTFQSDEERRPALPSAPLEERLKHYLESSIHSRVEEVSYLGNEASDLVEEVLSQKESVPVKQIKYFLDI
jgi:phosphorylcholine metabolism protein LicD